MLDLTIIPVLFVFAVFFICLTDRDVLLENKLYNGYAQKLSITQAWRYRYLLTKGQWIRHNGVNWQFFGLANNGGIVLRRKYNSDYICDAYLPWYKHILHYVYVTYMLIRTDIYHILVNCYLWIRAEYALIKSDVRYISYVVVCWLQHDYIMKQLLNNKFAPCLNPVQVCKYAGLLRKGQYIYWPTVGQCTIEEIWGETACLVWSKGQQYLCEVR